MVVLLLLLLLLTVLADVGGDAVFIGEVGLVSGVRA